MLIDLLSLFPDYFESPLKTSILGRAIRSGRLTVQQLDMRTFAQGKHRAVDDRTYGGGPGMVLMAEPVAAAIDSVKRDDSHVIYLSPQGKSLTAERCRQLSQMPHLVILSGHYEGVDQRVLDSRVDEEISIGDYVLTSGCPAALVLLDAVTRFIPGVLGHQDAAEQDSFEGDLLDYPHYTRPETFEDVDVPAVLRSGDHAKIAKWRHEQSKVRTQERRPDLFARYERKVNCGL